MYKKAFGLIAVAVLLCASIAKAEDRLYEGELSGIFQQPTPMTVLLQEDNGLYSISQMVNEGVVATLMGGMSLNETGFFSREGGFETIFLATEVYHFLGLSYIIGDLLIFNINVTSREDPETVVLELSFSGRKVISTSTPQVSASDKGISVFPNPAQDVVNIVLPESTPSEISIFSLSGALLKTVQGEGAELELSVANLPTGTYIVAVQQGENRYTKQVIVTTK